MNPIGPRPRFVAEVVSVTPSLAVRDPFTGSEPTVVQAPAPDGADAGAILEEGSWVEVAEEAGGFRVVDRLAEAGSARAGLYRIAAAQGLDPIHPPAVRAEARGWVDGPGIDAPELEDLTDVPFVTIDGASSRDLDQAVFVERPSSGGFVVWYALADASWYVRPGTPLHTEALARGASFYLPELVIPMLPRELSEGIISLNPEVERRAIIFRMPVDDRGRCRGTRILRGRIRSRAKLAFGDVQRYLDRPSSHPYAAAPFAASLRRLREVGEVLEEAAADRDVIRYRREEIEVSIDGRGLRFIAEGAPRIAVERYNEQISLLTNIEGARFLRDGDVEDDAVHPIYRIHPPPQRGRVRSLERSIDAITRGQGRDAEVWRRRPGQSLADYLAGLPAGPPDVRVARAIHRQAVYINGRSGFSSRPGGHFGVGASEYARFSAPMREVVGVFLHKEAVEKLAGLPVGAASRDDDERLRELIIDRANHAKTVQKQITRAANGLVLEQLFEGDLAGDREGRRGTVIGLERSKVHVLLDDPPIDVKVYVRHLEDDLGRDLVADDDGATLTDAGGSVVCRVGDGVTVRPRGRDDRRRWRLALRVD